MTGRSEVGADDTELLRSIFNELDEDASGELDRNEVRSLVTQLGMDASEKDVDAAMAAALVRQFAGQR